MVGDPLQLQPIVSLSPDLVLSLFREIGADPDEWAPPLVSAPTLTDQASRFVTTLEQDTGAVLVGVPLLVHRRCQEPMFSISNQIAYGGNMVFASSDKPSEIVEILGESRWIDVNGSGQSKWCEEEGRVVLSLVDRLHKAGLESPDLFIISPFVIVKHELQQRIATSEAAKAWSSNPFQWAAERIGTVHTFQGKEAEAVIFVLGAPNPEHAGARAWAGYPPNLLNVAATRAKTALYVVGSRELWRDKGCFSTLDRRMPLETNGI
jgi:superfamily I DNA and/or RNA helicase